jgi:O-antigen/teichoic acid export membrane protein
MKLPKIRLSKFLTDVASLSSGQVIMIMAEVTIGILVARLLGPAGKGIFTTAMVVPALVISFADLGLGSTITYFMGKKVYGDQNLISMIIVFVFLNSLLGITGALLAYLITGFQARYGWTVVLIPLGIIPARLAITYTNGVLMAKGQIPKLALVNLLPDTIYLVSVIALAIFGIVKVEFVLFFQVLAVVISAGCILPFVLKYGSLKPEFNFELFRKMLKKGVIYALAAFVIGLNYNVDIVILEHITNSTEVGVYSVGASIATIIWWLPSVINTVNFSHSASSTDSFAYAKKTAFILRVVLWVALLPVIVLFFLSPYVIPWIFGKAYSTSVIVVQAILPGVWAMLICKILYGDLAGRGQPEIGMWVFSLATVINIVLNIWWDPLFGAVGSAWASTVSYTIGGIIFGIVFARSSNLALHELFIIKKDDLKPILSIIGKV